MKVTDINMSLFLGLYKNVSDSVAVLNKDLEIIYNNASFADMYGFGQALTPSLDFLNSSVNCLEDSNLMEITLTHSYGSQELQSVLSKIEGLGNGLFLFLSKVKIDEADYELKVNESLARASSELISPSLSIDVIARIVFKACIELTQSETGFVAFDDPMSENILVHYFTDAYVGGKDMLGNIKFIGRDEYLQKGLLGYEINANVPVFNNDLSLKVLKSIGKHNPGYIKNYLTYPAIVDNVFMGQVVLFNSPNGFNQKHLDIICSLSNVYGLAVFRKRMELDLISAKEKAEESDRLKTAFLANMSHEIRTPMNAIVGFSQLVTSSSYNISKRAEFAELIQNSCTDLLKLVTEIIDLSKIEAKQMILYPESFAVEKILLEQIEITKHKAQAAMKNIDIQFESQTADLNITADASRFGQIVGNLLDNALKFTDVGFIRLSYKLHEPNHVIIIVEDSGIGIPYEKQMRVFESFQQLEVAMKRNYGGTGLGLSIVKNLTELMGGKVTVISTPNKGSQFSATFPLYRFSTNGKEKKQTIAPGNQDIRGKFILIVEDEPRNAKFLELLLKRERAKTKVVYNGKQAVEYVKQNTPDLILMDIRMPVMNGLEATKIIKNNDPLVPIIAQTAYAMKEDEALCIEAGCDAFIAKPVQKETLLELILDKLA